MIHTGDCVEVMAGMDAASVDAIVTDPPYGIRFMGKAWDGAAIEEATRKRQASRDVSERVYIRKDTGKPYSKATTYSDAAMNAGEYDFSLRGNRAFEDWCEAWASEALRVAKPGAYLLAFGGTRTYHRMACAIEDAGWIIRDCLVWAYASGFPKSRANLKPAWEPIVMARKPGPLRELAIDACRLPVADDEPNRIDTESRGGTARSIGGNGAYGGGTVGRGPTLQHGRWPANLILTDPIFDGDTPGVVGGGETSSGAKSAVEGDPFKGMWRGTEGRSDASLRAHAYDYPSDSGTYSRFFLVPKADRAEREPILPSGLVARSEGDGTTVRNARCGRCGRVRFAAADSRCSCPVPEWGPSSLRENVHPTVKPLDLMRHLVRLVTPTGGTVLDPFLGSGTTALAAEMEGFGWVGIEREAEYVAIAEARLNGTQRGLGLAV